MGTSRIDIDVLGPLVDRLDRVITIIQGEAGKVRADLDEVFLSDQVLAKWLGTGYSMDSLIRLRDDLKARLDKANLINIAGAGVTYGFDPMSWHRQMVLPGVVTMDDNDQSNLDDAQAVANWFQDVLNLKTDLDGGIPRDILEYLQAGATDTAFGVQLASLIPPDQLASLLNLMDLHLNNLGLQDPDRTDPATIAFQNQYSVLLDGLAGAYSTAIGSLPADSDLRASWLQAWDAVFRYAAPTDPQPQLLSVLIGRASWPDDFLDTISAGISAAEGVAGVGFWKPQWGTAPGNNDRVILDPGQVGIDGGPIQVVDPMYGVFMAASRGHPSWLLTRYGGHDMVDVSWGTADDDTAGLGSGAQGSGQIDQSLWALFNTRGLDPASFQALYIAASAADKAAIIAGPSDEWIAFTAQIGMAVSDQQRQHDEFEALPWWQKYGHAILGITAIMFGILAMFTPPGDLAIGFGVTSLAAMIGDSALSFMEGDWKDGLITLGLTLIIPVVGVGLAMRLVGVSLTEMVSLVNGGFIIRDGQIFGLAGDQLTVWDITNLTAEQQALLRADDVVVTGAGRLVMIDGKLLAISKDEWSSIQAGGFIARDGCPFGLIDGQLGWAGFRNDLDHHITTGDGITGKSISGAHNWDEFKKIFTDAGINPDDAYVGQPVEVAPGIYQINYKIPVRDSSGQVVHPVRWKQTPGFKTVYDPTMYTDQQMTQWARQAMTHAQPVKGRPGYYRGTAHGLKFEGIFVNGTFTTIYPVGNA